VGFSPGGYAKVLAKNGTGHSFSSKILLFQIVACRAWPCKVLSGLCYIKKVKNNITSANKFCTWYNIHIQFCKILNVDNKRQFVIDMLVYAEEFIRIAKFTVQIID
jgi:23S rRNA U2552 (ribose-2'-O)-methylase RlmE/FtsJ